jgi:uncharacterized protein
MPGKPASKKPNKKSAEKKISLSRLILIIFAIIIALSLIVLTTYNPGNKKSVAKSSSATSKSTPTFRKDGSLKIYRTHNPEPLLLEIEVADEEPERIRGLMDRFSMPENAGMLFIFDKDEPRSFWMKNTYIPLDIIYINAEKKIVSIQKYTHPRTTTSIPSEKPAIYVLEVNAGFTDKYGIFAGDKIAYELTY